MDYSGLEPGLPIFGSDEKEIGHVAEVREDAFRVDVHMRPDFWLPLEAIERADRRRVVLRMPSDRVDASKTPAPGTTRRKGEPADTFFAPEDTLSPEQREERYYDVERSRIP